MTVAAPYADRFKGLLDDLQAAGYGVQWGQSGGYNPRTIRGSTTPSQHAFGRAIDVNWDDNARGTRGNIPADLARQLAVKHGMTWGGDWRNPDPMHFEIADAGGAPPVAGRAFTAYAGLGGPQPQSTPAQQGTPTTMPTPSMAFSDPAPPENFFDRMATNMQSPLFMMGASVMGAPTIGEGLVGGARAAQQGAALQLMTNKARREMAQQQRRDAMWEQMFSSGSADDMLKGYPGITKQALYAMGPDAGGQLLGKLAAGRGDQQFQLDMIERSTRLKQQLDLEMMNRRLEMARGALGGAPMGEQGGAMAAPQDRAPSSGVGRFSGPAQPMAAPMAMAPQAQTPDPRQIAALEMAGVMPAGAGKVLTDQPQYQMTQRLQAAKAMGLDPKSPATQQYVLTGAYPKVERNYPAIAKADEAVTAAENSIDTGRHALALNKDAYAAEDWFPSARSMVGGWFGTKGAEDTQKYEAAAKLVSQELAKALGGARPSAFEQKLMSELQGGVNKTRAAREDALRQAIKHLEAKRALAARQAEELRNGTYYDPGQRPAAPQAPSVPSSQAPSVPSSSGWTVERAD